MSRGLLDKANWELQIHNLERLFQRRVNDPNDAEDLAQEVVTQAFASSDRFDPTRGRYETVDDQVGAWLKGIAEYRFAEFLRKKKKEQEALQVLFDQGMEELDTFDINLDDLQSTDATLDAMQAAMRDCSPALQEVAKYFFLGLTPQEIAQNCSITINTAHKRISRLRKHIKLHLEDLKQDQRPQVIFASEINYYQAMNQYLHQQQMEGCHFGDADCLRNYINYVDNDTTIDQEAAGVLKRARRAIEQSGLSLEDKEYVVGELNELTLALQNKTAKPSLIRRYWNHIKEVAPTVATILKAITAIAP